jgi:hypothetical protein
MGGTFEGLHNSTTTLWIVGDRIKGSPAKGKVENREFPVKETDYRSRLRQPRHLALRLPTTPVSRSPTAADMLPSGPVKPREMTSENYRAIRKDWIGF